MRWARTAPFYASTARGRQRRSPGRRASPRSSVIHNSEPSRRSPMTTCGSRATAGHSSTSTERPSPRYPYRSTADSISSAYGLRRRTTSGLPRNRARCCTSTEARGRRAMPAIGRSSASRRCRRMTMYILSTGGNSQAYPTPRLLHFDGTDWTEWPLKGDIEYEHWGVFAVASAVRGQPWICGESGVYRGDANGNFIGALIPHQAGVRDLLVTAENEAWYTDSAGTYIGHVVDDITGDEFLYQDLRRLGPGPDGTILFFGAGGTIVSHDQPDHPALNRTTPAPRRESIGTVRAMRMATRWRAWATGPRPIGGSRTLRPRSPSFRTPSPTTGRSCASTPKATSPRSTQPR